MYKYNQTIDFPHPQAEDGRFVCSKENPMPSVIPARSKWSHPDAVETAEDYGPGGGVSDGDFVQYTCPHCKKSFWVELSN